VAVRIEQLDIYRTAIPMRRFEHAAAGRDLAEAIVVRAARSDGSAGWGETLPRDYVTGETLETVPRDIEEVLWPAVRGPDVSNLDRLSVIPNAAGDGRCINAALCAVELAVVSPLIGPGPGGRRIAARVSGVLGSADPARTARRLRLMRWYGLRDFKLKLGFGDDIDAENLRLVGRRIGRAIRAGRCTLRVDVNGAWTADETPDRVAALAAHGVCVVEQPVFAPPTALVELARRCDLPLMADESLVTADDADELVREPRRVWWNIRISKNGGPLHAAALAREADENGVPFTFGCMVGESGILSAAQRRVLQGCPAPRFVEGNYGTFLLADDLTRPSPRFGYGGRLKRLKGPGLGVAVDPRQVARYGSLIRSLRA